MNRPTLLIRALAAVALVLAGGLALRSSGLATHPSAAVAAMPSGTVFAPYSVPEGPFVAPMLGGRVRWEGTYGNLIDNSVYHFGVYEKGEVLLVQRLLEQTGGDFLDIGANFGNYTFYLAEFAGTVHAIEPWPPAVDRMRKIAALNPQVTNVRIHPVGYSDQPGTLPYHEPPPNNLGTGSFDGTFAEDRSGTVVQLPLVAGDAHLAEVGAGRIGVVKCDIEGFERYAFEGLAETLRRDRPAVMFELNVAEGGFTSHEQLERTFPPGYSFYEIELDGHWMLDFVWFGWYYGSEATGRYRLKPLTDLHRTNALALPDERNLLPALR